MIYKASSGARFSNAQTQLLFKTNKNVTMTVNGDFTTPNPLITSLTANIPEYRTFSLTNGDWWKWIYTKFSGTTETVQATNVIYLDTTGPVITNALPIHGITGLSWAIQLGRIGSDDGVGMGAWIAGYYYYITTSGTSYTITGFATGITTSIPSYKFIYSWTHNWNIVGVDQLGNRWATGATRSFDYIATVDAEPDAFSFTPVTDADTNTAYMSNIVTITGMTPNVEVPVSIDNGVLYISGIVVGRTWTVKQGSTIKIELISSNDIDETVTSTLSIGSQIIKYRVKTSQESDWSSTLSAASKLNVLMVFETITDLYANNKSKQVEFMVTFKSMLTDLIDEMESDNSLSTTETRKLSILKYLLDITENFIDDENISDQEVHTAPNGRVYKVIYDDNKACYTSPNFLSANKCFPTLAGMKSYIDANNLAWTHTVDTTWKAQNYQAPSGKTYTILKTTSWKYFSYRFISPKYFNSLKETQTYISKNNPKGKGR